MPAQRLRRASPCKTCMRDVPAACERDGRETAVGHQEHFVLKMFEGRGLKATITERGSWNSIDHQVFPYAVDPDDSDVRRKVIDLVTACLGVRFVDFLLIT